MKMPHNVAKKGKPAAKPKSLKVTRRIRSLTVETVASVCELKLTPSMMEEAVRVYLQTQQTEPNIRLPPRMLTGLTFAQISVVPPLREEGETNYLVEVLVPPPEVADALRNIQSKVTDWREHGDDIDDEADDEDEDEDLDVL